MKNKKRIVRVGLIKFVPKKWKLEYNWGMFEKLADPHAVIITDPRGETAAELQNNVPGVLVHDINLSDVNNNRIANRRSDIYEV